MARKKINVLAIGSHPDDIEFGCGGSLSKFVSQGHNVYMLVMSSGSRGGDPKKRKAEQLESAKILGVKDVFWGGYEDTRMSFHEGVIRTIEDIVKETDPTFVFVHHGNDTHQDHRYICSSAVVATRNIRNVLHYEGPTTYGFEPNVFIDIEGTIKEKFKSLSCHKSQVMRTNIEHQSIVDIARATATFRGTQCRVAYAEAFSSLRLFLLA